jgi:hypothetical protein
MGFIRDLVNGTTDDTDDRYWRNLGYVLELNSPEDNVIMPLLLGLQEYSFDRDFAKDVQLAQDGGVHVSEYGVLLGRIRISVDPGVTPVRAGSEDARKLSGHKRFLEVRDRIFQAYSEAKQDPESAKDTFLTFYSLKDDDAWTVVPERFSLHRSSSAAASYPYTVELLAVKQADIKNLYLVDPDKSLLQTFTDTARSLRQSLGMVRAAIDDATFYLDEARTATVAWVNILNTISEVADAVNNFLIGVDRMVKVPHYALRALLSNLETLVTYSADWKNLDDNTRRWWAELEDQIYMFAALPDAFSESLDVQVQEAWRRRSGVAGKSAVELARADGTLQGTGAGPNDYQRAAAQPARQAPAGYSGWQSIVLDASDTPAGIAARYSVPWSDVAAANRLWPPYFSDVDLPNTRSPGDTLLVPLRGLAARPDTISVGAPDRESQQDDIFGRDFLLDQVEGIAPAGDDAATVAGVENVLQAIGIRLDTDLGSNVPYPGFGRRDFVGSTNSLANIMLLEIDTKRTLAEDKRVTKVQNVVLVPNGTEYRATLDLVLADRSSVRTRGRLLT